LEEAYYLPIYLDYNVLDIDEDYRYALVSGSSMGYLWLLSRDVLPDETFLRLFWRNRLRISGCQTNARRLNRL
jgi:apolipoprotein D and lipocalin family protein